MDKNAIKKYAVWARRELIERVSQRAIIYGISSKDTGDPNAESVNGHLLSQAEKRQRQALIHNIKEKGYEQVIEEVAYTWFNRFAALRFMEVNGYLPSHIRVFTNDAGEFKPQILAEAIHLELDGLDMNKVYELENNNKSDELFKYLLIVQCNALNSVLPGMFQRIEDYTELLLPDYLLREGSVIHKLVTEIPEADFDVFSGDGQIEIIGWLYQYYISEKHEEVVDPLHGKVVKKEEVPAATQLFTTDWVVRYLIDNSVGRYWIERNPDSSLAEKLTYFVRPKSRDQYYVNETITPQELTTFDPRVGSGHFLVYAFDVLMEIYKEYGYSEREAAAEIVKHNLYGLDIDGRAVQLAYFAVMMKARQYDRRFFSRNIQPNIYEILESNSVDQESIRYFCGDDLVLTRDVNELLEALIDAKEYGSILHVPAIDFGLVNDRFSQISSDISIYSHNLMNEFRQLVRVSEILGKSYAIVATNPPYLNKYDPKLKGYVLSNYNDYKGDLFSVFTVRCLQFCKRNGYAALMTPNVWMFIKTYEKLRNHIIEHKTISTLVQMAKGAFFKEATVDVCSFVIKNERTDEEGIYFKLDAFKGDMEAQNLGFKQALQSENCNYIFFSNMEKFKTIPGHPIAYWVSEELSNIFTGDIIKNHSISDGQTKTGDNNKYLRFIWEVDSESIGRDKKWVFIVKGGLFRRWYGNLDTVINWSETAREFYRRNMVARIAPEYIWWKEGVCWNHISSKSEFAIRKLEEQQLFETGANAILIDNPDDLHLILGYLNSKVAEEAIHIINPTLNSNIGDITVQPFRNYDDSDVIIECVRTCIALSKQDWDSFETSWDFAEHPFLSSLHGSEGINSNKTLKQAFESWKSVANSRFVRLKENEEKLNSIFIKFYGLQEVLMPEVEDKDVTVRKADLHRDVRSFISYAVGCMFGRYSLDIQGLVFAGGDWKASNYELFQPDSDAIIPISDDEYFADDILGRFINFVEIAFGRETLDENLSFIASALGGKGSSREVIRNYFINDFYSDHLKTYQKRPIYWLFDSGKKNGFKCLIYMHRYQPDTIARIRTDYVHEQQSRYRTAIADLEPRINGASGSEKVKLTKQLAKLQAQAEEIRVYEEKIHHLADQMIRIDLDDGVKHNYEIFKDVLAKIK